MSQSSTIGSIWPDDFHLSRLRHHMTNVGELSEQINYVNLIAADCGWHPLVLGEKMEVTLGGNTYMIKRTS